LKSIFDSAATTVELTTARNDVSVHKRKTIINSSVEIQYRIWSRTIGERRSRPINIPDTA
jgi:hypothetical protein